MRVEAARRVGSRGVVMLGRDLTARACEEAVAWHLTTTTGDSLVEAVAEGREVGCDAVVQDGHCEVVLLRDKELTPAPWRQEVTYTAPAALTGAENAVIDDALARVLQGLDVRNALINADVILDRTDRSSWTSRCGRWDTRSPIYCSPR